MKIIKLAEVKQAEKDWLRTVTNSINPRVDLAVTRAEQKYRDLKAEYENQKSRKRARENQEKENPNDCAGITNEG